MSKRRLVIGGKKFGEKPDDKAKRENPPFLINPLPDDYTPDMQEVSLVEARPIQNYRWMTVRRPASVRHNEPTRVEVTERGFEIRNADDTVIMRTVDEDRSDRRPPPPPPPPREVTGTPLPSFEWSDLKKPSWFRWRDFYAFFFVGLLAAFILKMYK